jgi:hypothetical protein
MRRSILSHSPSGRSRRRRKNSRTFARAAAILAANLVDHVDELTLMQDESLQVWSSLPEYSASPALAFAPWLSPHRGSRLQRAGDRLVNPSRIA